jgi:hypothetical protein
MNHYLWPIADECYILVEKLSDKAGERMPNGYVGPTTWDMNG